MSEAFSLDEEVLIRFATPAEMDFLQQDLHVPAQILERKVVSERIVVAEWNGSLIGSLEIDYLWSSIPYIALIYVLPSYRLQGVGKALLGFIELFLRNRGYDVLYSSAQANEPEPQAWHRQVGFEECGMIAGINRGGVGEIFFRKWL